MADQIYPNLRIAPSGPSVQGTTGHFLKKVDGGVQFAEVPSPGGSVTPLNAVGVVDAASSAATPDGAWSGDKAFSTVVAALAALAPLGGGGIPIAPGAYTEVLDVTDLSIEMYGLGSPGEQPVIAGSLTLGGSEPPGFASLRNLQYAGAIDGQGSGALRTENIVCRGPANLASMDSRWSTFGTNPITALGSLTDLQGTFAQAVTVTGNSDLRGSVFANDFATATVHAEGCTFSAVHATGAASFQDCSFLAGALRTDAAAVIDNCQATDATATNLIIGAAGTTTQVNNSRFAGIVEFGDGTFNVHGSTFAKATATTSPGTLRMWDCLFDTSGSPFTLASQNLFMDAASEKNALLAAVDLNVVIHALELGQGGDALSITSTDATVDFSVQTRGYLKQQTLTADHTFQINLTGAVRTTQEWIIDNYNRTAHSLTVKDDTGATIATIGTVAAGTALRYVFIFSSSTNHVVLDSISKL